MENTNVIEVKKLKKYFPVRSGLFKQKSYFRAVDDVSFTIKQRSVHALVGESGCGKSTVSRMLLRLIQKTDGDVLYKGSEIFGLKGADLKAYRKAVSIVFQDPYASLNPRMKILDTLTEPLKIHNMFDRKKYLDIVKNAVNRVGLPSEILKRYPHEFSGGQRQRICIARALILSPEVIVADEPLSSLDVSIQAQILNLLKGLMDEGEEGDKGQMSMFFISHDLNVVRYLSDEISVMYLGRIVEQAKTDDLFNQPLHPYTDMLIEAAPKIRTGASDRHVKDNNIERYTSIDDVSGLKPKASNEIFLYSSCSFQPRCHKRMDICALKSPELVKHNGRLVSCHLFGKK